MSGHKDHRSGCARGFALGCVLLAAACGGGGDGDADAGIGPGEVEPFPEIYCPGSPGCEAGGGDQLRVGAARADITPELIETEWTDDNGNGHYDIGEDFVDVNDNGRFDAVWIAGFDNGRPATGVHDTIWVRAMVFDLGDVRLGLAVVDAVGWFASDIDATREMLEDSLELDHVIVASTHVHETPDTIGLWGRQELETGIDPDYQALVQSQTAQAFRDAVAALEPVRMEVASVLTLDEGGSVEPYTSDSRDPVVIDPTMTVLRFAATDEPDRTVATLVHWASHPEYFWSRNTEITADYPYYLRDVVENGIEENPVRGLPALDGLGGEVVFLNGTIGGLIYPGRAHPIGADGQPVQDNGEAKAEAAGRNLGRLALEAITSAETAVDVASPQLAFRTGRMYLTVENTFYHVGALVQVFDREFVGHDPTKPLGPDNLPYIESRVSYLEIGNVGIVSAPGEMFPETAIGGYDGSHTYGFDLVDPNNENPPNLAAAPDGPYLKDLILMNDGIDHALVAGMTEDFVGYIPPAYDYILASVPYIEEAPGDHYEETNSVGPSVEAEVTDAQRRLITWTDP